MTTSESTKYFIEKWNDLDVIISSMDIKGYNVDVIDRTMILEDNLEKVVCWVVENEIYINITAKQLIGYYLDGTLKVFQEIPYI